MPYSQKGKCLSPKVVHLKEVGPKEPTVLNIFTMYTANPLAKLSATIISEEELQGLAVDDLTKNLWDGLDNFQMDTGNEIGSIHRLGYIFEKLKTGAGLAAIFDSAKIFCGAGDFATLLVKLQGCSTDDDMQVFVVRLADGRLLVNLEDKFDYTMTGSEENKKKWSERHCAGRNFEKYTSIEWHAGRKAQPSKASAKCETSEQECESAAMKYLYYVDVVHAKPGGTPILLSSQVDHIGRDGHSPIEVKSTGDSKLEGKKLLRWPIRYGATGAQLCVGYHDGTGILEKVELIDPMEKIPREVPPPPKEKDKKEFEEVTSKKTMSLVKNKTKIAENFRGAREKGDEFFQKLLRKTSSAEPFWQITIKNSSTPLTEKRLASISDVARGILPKDEHADGRERLKHLFNEVLQHNNAPAAPKGAPSMSKTMTPITSSIQ
ncbi:unnamed protein product, partial [Mesorhabditis spiculigera]